MISTAWVRVRKDKPCPICERPDWCLLSKDGAACICARVESGKRCGDAGWLHRLVDTPWQPARSYSRSIPLTSTSTARDWSALARSHQASVDAVQLDGLARGLGLSVEALQALGIGWSATHRAWSFPMTDGGGKVLGIRLRRPDGRKFSVTGGKEGLFVPAGALDLDGDRLVIVEGATDSAAVLDMGFRSVIGRPSCTGGVRLLVELMRRKRPNEVVVVADADDAGVRGADSLAAVLVAYAQTVRVIVPPVKDVRAWLQAGGTAEDVQAAIQAVPVRRLKIKATKG